MGRACNKAVTIAEILKRKAPLHQITSLSSCELVDVFEPLEEVREDVDRVSSFIIQGYVPVYFSCPPLNKQNVFCLERDLIGLNQNDLFPV